MNDRPHQPDVFDLGALTLDLAQGRLIGAGGDVELRAKSFALLGVLVRNAGRTMSKDALLSAVWPGLSVTEDSLTQCVHDIRRALGPDAAAVLRTVPKRGYLVDLDRAPLAAADDAGTIHPGSIAVMPFRPLREPSEAERVIFDGLTQDIIGRLARLRSFRVVGRGSSFALRHLEGQTARLRRILHVAFLVTGTVRGLAGAWRLTVELQETAGGEVLWSDDYALGADDLMTLAQPGADRIVATIARQITLHEVGRAVDRGEASADAWHLLHLGLDRAFRFDRQGVPEALGLFQRAAALEPRGARPHAFVSFCQYHMAFARPEGQRRTRAAPALAAASDALFADDSSPLAHWAYGRALWLGGDSAAGLQHCRRAVDLAPSFPNARYMIGFVEAHHGDGDTALAELAASEDLSPFDPFIGSIQLTRAHVHLDRGDDEGAAALALMAARHVNSYGMMLLGSALILAATGAEDAAREALARARDKTPDLRANWMFATLYDMKPRVRAGLRRGAARLGLSVG